MVYAHDDFMVFCKRSALMFKKCVCVYIDAPLIDPAMLDILRTSCIRFLKIKQINFNASIPTLLNITLIP